jgi:hypothetical protein
MFYLFEEFKKLRLPIEVNAISGRVLGNENEFFGSLMKEILCLLEQGRKRKRNLLSSDIGDNAKRARIVAAFGDFEVFKALVEIGQGSGRWQPFKVVKGVRLKAIEELGKGNGGEVISGKKGNIGIVSDGFSFVVGCS